MDSNEMYMVHIVAVVLISMVVGCYCKSTLFPQVNIQDIEIIEHDIESLERRVNEQQRNQRQRDVHNIHHVLATPIETNIPIVETRSVRTIRPDTPIYRGNNYVYSETDSDESSPSIRRATRTF